MKEEALQAAHVHMSCLLSVKRLFQNAGRHFWRQMKENVWPSVAVCERQTVNATHRRISLFKRSLARVPSSVLYDWTVFKSNLRFESIKGGLFVSS